MSSSSEMASSREDLVKPSPDYVAPRFAFYSSLKAKYDAYIKSKIPSPIQITLSDGIVVEGQSWRTTPYEVTVGISKSLAEDVIIAKVNGELWDLDRPFESNSTLQLLKFDDEEGQQVFWHSSAHILGEAMENHYGGCLCYGPPTDSGFYYDMYMREQQVSSNDIPRLQTEFESIVSEQQPFERLEMTKAELLEMFKYNEFKCRIINEKITTPTTTVYRCGPLIDLCRGPHLRHTGKVKAALITKNSSTYWEGNSQAESLQRIYGVSFPETKQLDQWKRFQEEAAKRDHRKLGKEQELYFFHELSPGSCFFLPKGAHIYNTLVEFMRSEYRRRGYQEVVTPNIFNSRLWVTSGHWDHYSENMFKFEVEKETYALKPMNCPGHCLMFDHRPRSWRELPLRVADFGVLHRNELSGALSGLTRVRRFQQDDAHIFCMQEQISDEIRGCLDFLKCVYGVFGFTFKLFLSTRPEKFMGDPVLWDQAEKQLESSLVEFGHPWKLNPGDGAFYGPKIDIIITDALNRPHQCATIQLDFQLPERFNLTYTSTDCGESKKRPVIVHRAMLGSVERMIGVLTENFGGKWPFWLSPRQAAVIPVSSQYDGFAKKVQQEFHHEGFMVDVDLNPGDTLNKKIRAAQLSQYNYILVVGEREESNGTVNVRTRSNVVHGEKTIPDVVRHFRELREKKTADDARKEW